MFSVFDNQIVEDCFFSKREYSKIFRKKGYFSKDREKDIIFDVSIEVTIPGQDCFSLLFLIECKNYSHSVPVDDVEEFFAKIQQVSGANAKGFKMVRANMPNQKVLASFAISIRKTLNGFLHAHHLA